MVASCYKVSQYKEHLLKRKNFEILVLICTVLDTHGYKEHRIDETILVSPNMFLIAGVHCSNNYEFIHT